MRIYRCIFCSHELTGTRTKEHVIPVWLQQHLGITDAMLSPTRYSGKTGEVLSTRSHGINGLVAGRVCSTCNNGWMSQLEIVSMPILISLMATRRPVSDLTGAEKTTLARWAAKTAYVLNFSSNSVKNVPLEHMRYLYRNGTALPNGVTVCAQQHNPTMKFNWLQGAQWQILNTTDVGDEVRNKLSENGYKITLQLQSLLFTVGHLPHPPLKFSFWNGIHLPLWPTHGIYAWYEKDGFPWNDSRMAIHYFHAGLLALYDEDPSHNQVV